MSRSINFLLVLLVVVGFVFISCNNQTPCKRVLIIGRTDCVPCLEMKELTDEINTEFGIDTAEFINIETDDSAIKKYSIGTLPTSIFFDIDGKEYYRQTKAMSKEEFTLHLNEGDHDE